MNNNDIFYSVTFINSNEIFYFHFYEDAAAFLINSYLEDYPNLTEDQIFEINNEIADTEKIEDYGYISEEYFEY